MLIFLLTIVTFGAVSRAQAVKVMGSELAEEKVTQKDMSDAVGFLCSDTCAGRGTGSEGCAAAAKWISGRFDAMGLKSPAAPWTGTFLTPDGLPGKNVCAVLDGGKGNSSYILMTAHYDGLGMMAGKTYPGADSNASGVAAMLGVAQMMKFWTFVGRKYSKSILFVALDGKYHGHSGAKAIWDDLSSGAITDPYSGKAIGRKDIALAVNIDQIGATLSPPKSGRKDYLIMLSQGGYGFYGQVLSKADRDYGTGLELMYDYYGSRDFTELFYRKVCDQKVFLEGGCNAVMFTSGITMNNNKPADIPSTLDYPVMLRRIRLIFHWMDRII